MNQDELIPHLFRTEYRKIVSVLAKRFGFEQLEIAEDIASETFLTATQTWGLAGYSQKSNGMAVLCCEKQSEKFFAAHRCVY